jgi:hypothetical protein
MDFNAFSIVCGPAVKVFLLLEFLRAQQRVHADRRAGRGACTELPNATPHFSRRADGLRPA